MSIKQLAQKVIDLYAQEKSAGEDELFQALIDLGDQAEVIVQMEDALAALWKEAPDGPAHRAAFDAIATAHVTPAVTPCHAIKPATEYPPLTGEAETTFQAVIAAMQAAEEMVVEPADYILLMQRIANEANQRTANAANH